ncbi:hypothetical protein [Provencibacterium massiliense]|uniref:glycan biosynthesis hexose transferase WsfD n=1 Tax=Provencibacterium massiliense TaxID=1841868 RepID=UPI0009A8FFE7|nr:hypothetical protein [Provencibacterium massiliense]RGB65588.1 hypothetical protein DW086_10295 [Harryflintia acetispora]
MRWEGRGLKTWKDRLPSPPLLAVLAAAVIMLATLFLPPVVGMADNGDFFRVIDDAGLYKFDRYEKDQYFNYFAKEFGVFQYFKEYGEPFFSSQMPFVRAAMHLDRLFTGDSGVFDVRFLGALFCLWGLLAIYLLVDYAAYGRPRSEGYLIAALAVFFFADTGYIAYFNSFFAEGLVMVSFLTCLASILLIDQHRYNPYLLLAVFFVSGLVLCSAKQQNAPLGFLLAGLLACMAFRYQKYERLWRSVRREGNVLYITPPVDAPDFWEQERAQLQKLRAALGRRGPRRWIRERFGRERRERRHFKKAALLLSALLALSGAAVYLLIPQEFVNINKYHAMTRGVLMTSQNPEEAVGEFGIDPQYALLDRTIYFDHYPPVDVEGAELRENFYPKYGFVSISLYYLRHPGELMQMIDYAARSAYAIRPEAMGNYERSAGRDPGARDYTFALHSSLKQALTPRTVGYMFIWIAVVLLCGMRERWRTLVLAFAILMGLSQFGVSIIGAGDADLSKHVFLYNVAYDFTNFIVISTVLVPSLSARRAKKRQGGPALTGERRGDKQREEATV